MIVTGKYQLVHLPMGSLWHMHDTRKDRRGYNEKHATCMCHLHFCKMTASLRWQSLRVGTISTKESNPTRMFCRRFCSEAIWLAFFSASVRSSWGGFLVPAFVGAGVDCEGAGDTESCCCRIDGDGLAASCFDSTSTLSSLN